MTRLRYPFAEIGLRCRLCNTTEYIDTAGGLAARADGARIRLSKAGLARSEPQLPIHGYAVAECPALEQATDVASRLLRLHQDFVPD